MTNEEAIRFGNCILMVADKKTDSVTIEFTQMALKALEQGDVLREIRQEVNDEFLRCDANAWTDIAKGLLSARCIIDKKIKELSE